MATEPVPDLIPAWTAFGIVGGLWLALIGWLHGRQNSEARTRKEGDDALWNAVNQVNRDLRDVATKADIAAMELRLTDLIHERRRGGHA